MPSAIRCFSILIVAVLLFYASAPAQAADSAKRPPNVLLVLTDDQGFGDVASHGNTFVETPVHDRLAASGARFDRFFVSPVCAPTRSSLLTGRHHLRCGVHGVTRTYETMRADEVTLAEVFKQNGYATGCFGKWHNGAHYPHNPNGQGFDEFLGFCSGHWNNYFTTTLEHNGQWVQPEGFIIDVLTDAAIGFMKEHRDEPFFCYVPYNTPHSPFQVPDKYFDKYKAKGLDNKLACVYGMVENIDDNMGRMLATLDELGLSHDTIVIFLTDNGANGMRYNAGMKGCKGSLHEGGTRVPFFIAWPGHIKEGTVVEQIAAHTDVLPTLVELCGLPTPETKPLDGRSLVPLLEGDTANWPERTILTHWGGNLDPPNRGAVRTPQYRAVLYKQWELYDMLADPDQKKNIAKDNPELTQELAATFERMYADVAKDGFDVIPTEIGHEGWDTVMLPGHEAFLVPETKQGISYKGSSGWANDYLTNWTDTSAYATWPIKVVTPGEYEVSIAYICPRENTGAVMRVEVGDAGAEAMIDKAYLVEDIPSPDREPRKEVYERYWKLQKLGRIMIPEGEAELKLKAVKIPGEMAPEVKAVTLKKAG